MTPTASDSIVISVDATPVFGGPLLTPMRIYNFTSFAIDVHATYSRGNNSAPHGPDWSQIVSTIDRFTPNGWEDYASTIEIYPARVTLQPNECLQASNQLYGRDSGTYRVGVLHGQEWAYSDSVVVP